MLKSVATLLIALAIIPFFAAAAQETTPTPTARQGGMFENRNNANAQATDEAPYDLSEIAQLRAEDGGFVLGDPDAPITIVEFADWACSHCQDYAPVMQQLIETYVVTGMARFEYRIFPTSGGETTLLAGRVLECIDNERDGAFWELHTALYELAAAGSFYERVIKLIAPAYDLDNETVLDCAEDEATTQVEVDTALAYEVGVRGTPTLRVRYGTFKQAGNLEVIVVDDVNYELGSVPFDVLSAVIEEANDAE